MKIKILIPFLVCLILLGACVTRQAPAPVVRHGGNMPTGTTVEQATEAKVAVLLPLSGNNAMLGQSMLQAAQLALFDLGNNDLQLMPHDTKGTESGAQDATRNAIRDGAQIIVGPLFADAVRGAQQITSRTNTKIIAFSTDWSLADRSTFVMGFMPFSQVDRIADYASEKNLNRFAIIAPRDKYGDVVSTRFENRAGQNGGTIVHNISYTPNDPAITSLVSSIDPSSIDAVFVPANGSDLKIITNTLTTRGMPPEKIKRLGTGLWDNPVILSQSGVQGGWFAAPSPAARQNFERQYQATYGQKPLRLTTLAYDAMALASVLSSRNYSYDAFTNPNGFDGVDGVFRFGKDGIIQRNLAVLEINNGSVREIAPAARRF